MVREKLMSDPTRELQPDESLIKKGVLCHPDATCK